MQYWLFKSEPNEWSYQDQQAKFPEAEEWSGVRNAQARNFMQKMAVGDLGFFYHSQKERAIVGVVEVASLAHPDSTTDDPKWVCVDLRAVAPMPLPVTLPQIKADGRFEEMALLRQSRLSVQPVTAEHWEMICQMGGYKSL